MFIVPMQRRMNVLAKFGKTALFEIVVPNLVPHLDERMNVPLLFRPRDEWNGRDMAISQAMRAANRANALRSTGPKSEAGQAAGFDCGLPGRGAAACLFTI
jgi:hypothetical protein